MATIPECPKCNGTQPRYRFLIRTDGVPVIVYECWDCGYVWKEVNPNYVHRNFAGAI